jgi:hypothetical protein
MLQVPWKVQLLVSSIEEAAKYSALTATRCGEADNDAEALGPSTQLQHISLAVVAAAVAVSALVDVMYRAAYASAISKGLSTVAAPQQDELAAVAP